MVYTTTFVDNLESSINNISSQIGIKSVNILSDETLLIIRVNTLSQGYTDYQGIVINSIIIDKAPDYKFLKLVESCNDYSILIYEKL